MSRAPRWIVLAVLAAVPAVPVSAVTSSAKTGTARDDDQRGQRPSVYTIPGDAVFPEGIARSGKSFFVSSTTDGTIFKGDVKQAATAPFAAGGADGRTTAVGLKVDGRWRLLVAGGQTGKAFVLSTADGSTLKVLSEIDLGGRTLTNGDGLAAHGSRLFVVRNADNEIVVVKLRRGKREGRVVRAITSDLFMFPTTAARAGKRLLVVNAQFDKRGGTPVLPFTVAAVRRP